MDITVSGHEPDNERPANNSASSSRALVVSGPAFIEGEFTELTEKEGFLRRLFSKATRDAIFERGKDMAAGAAITTAARLGSVAVVGGAGLTGLPLIMVGGVAAGVARTAWTIHKDRKAHALETGEKLSFWQWALKNDLTKKDDEGNDVLVSNRSKYLLSLSTSTAFATLGSSFMTYALPKIEEYAAPVLEKTQAFLAPVVEKVKEAEILSTIGASLSSAVTAVSDKSSELFSSGAEKVRAVGSSLSSAFSTASGWFGFGQPELAAEAAPVADKTDASPKSWEELLAGGPREMPTFIREALEQPSASADGLTPHTPDAIQERIDQAHAAAAEAAAPTPAPAPAITEYQVKRGDNLWKIAQSQYGIKDPTEIRSAVEAITAANDMTAAQASRLSIGQVLKLPEDASALAAAAEVTPPPVISDYEVKRGDSLWKIAQSHYGLKSASEIQSAVETIAATNNMTAAQARSLDIGQVIKLPDSPAPVAGQSKMDWTAAASTTPAATASADPIGDLIATLPAADAPAKLPQDATLKVVWSQNADGRIEGLVENPPSWLKDGMKVEVPVAYIK